MGLLAALCLVLIPSCSSLKLLTRPGWYLGNYFPEQIWIFRLICKFPYLLLSARFSTAISMIYSFKAFFDVEFFSWHHRMASSSRWRTQMCLPRHTRSLHFVLALQVMYLLHLPTRNHRHVSRTLSTPFALALGNPRFCILPAWVSWCGPYGHK